MRISINNINSSYNLCFPVKSRFNYLLRKKLSPVIPTFVLGPSPKAGHHGALGMNGLAVMLLVELVQIIDGENVKRLLQTLLIGGKKL
jgi:hypothetical protein